MTADSITGSATAFARAQAHASTTAGLRSELIGERNSLIQQKSEIVVRIAEYDRLIAELTPATATQSVTEPEDSSKMQRVTGVKQLVEKIVRDLQVDHTWLKQDAVIDAAARVDVRMQAKSVVSALGRLTEEGVLLREGKRGSFVYALATIKPDSLEPVAELSPQELILGKLKTSGSEGASKKDLSWAVGDVATIELVLEKLIADGEIRLSESGMYVLAERVQHQRPLFESQDDTASAER